MRSMIASGLSIPAIENLQMDSCKNQAMTRLLLESVSVPQELIDQRLAIATAHSQEQLRCNYEANPRYCTFANSWSTPCREHSTSLCAHNGAFFP